MFRGFVDLRQHLHPGWAPEHFWPSFTDLMMVVTMIFMLVATVLMIHHWRLTQTLESSIAAHSAAEQRLADLESRRARLLQDVTALAAQRETLQEQLQQSEGQSRQQSQIIIDQAERLAAMTNALTQLRERLSASQDLRTKLTDDLQTAREATVHWQDRYQTLQDQSARKTAQQAGEIEHLTQQLAKHTGVVQREIARAQELETALTRARKEVTTLRAQLDGSEQRQAELANQVRLLRDDRSDNTAEYAELKAQFQTLKAKYDQLVRPARSPEGKVVVVVRYLQIGKNKRIELKRPADSTYQIVNQGQLHRELGALKSQYGNKLYVKVVIPEDSGLSYADAWGFTQSLLSRYDYYYQ